MTSKEITEKTGMSLRLVNQWAKMNKLNRIEIEGILAYDWSEEDLQRFLNRPTKRGRPWPEKNKREN